MIYCDADAVRDGSDKSASLFVYKNDEKIIFAYGIIDYRHGSIGGTRFGAFAAVVCAPWCGGGEAYRWRGSSHRHYTYW